MKKFDPSRQISPENWRTLEEALRLSPSSYGLQPWKFLVVTSRSLRKTLVPVSHDQRQIEDCSHLVVVTHLKKINEQYIHDYIKQVAESRKMPVSALQEYSTMMVSNVVHGKQGDELRGWTARQAYIAMGAFITVASLLQIDVCPMEGIERDQYDQIFNLGSSAYTTAAVMAAGYRAKDDGYQFARKVRFDRAKVIEVIE